MVTGIIAAGAGATSDVHGLMTGVRDCGGGVAARITGTGTGTAGFTAATGFRTTGCCGGCNGDDCVGAVGSCCLESESNRAGSGWPGRAGAALEASAGKRTPFPFDCTGAVRFSSVAIGWRRMFCSTADRA